MKMGIDTKRAAFGWHKVFEIKRGSSHGRFSDDNLPVCRQECDSKCCQTKPAKNILS